MLLEMYLFLEVIAIIAFGLGFFRKSEWFWSLAIILFGILIFASYDITQNVSVVNNQTMVGTSVYYNTSIVQQHNVDKTYSYLNMGLFLVSLILFIFDLFDNWRINKSAQR